MRPDDPPGDPSGPISRPPRLTDRAALARNRARAERKGPVDWLHELARDEIQDRLAEVNRRFTAPAVVTGRPDFWAAAFPQARIVADDPVLDLTPQAHDL
ncbi:MAG TPA: SAM-dependent methyltransferase, partial [Paracoccus sp. (in: a-proteobacteria)]|nr:SAM-dependent methyltransferase [Paracoccus sp. (in: a-proteobacteria)]